MFDFNKTFHINVNPYFQDNFQMLSATNRIALGKSYLRVHEEQPTSLPI